MVELSHGKRAVGGSIPPRGSSMRWTIWLTKSPGVSTREMGPPGILFPSHCLGHAFLYDGAGHISGIACLANRSFSLLLTPYGAPGEGLSANV